jgi:hypothetical protein
MNSRHPRQEQLKAALPQAQIVTMPGPGHYPSEENAKDFITIADRFLNGIPARFQPPVQPRYTPDERHA